MEVCGWCCDGNLVGVVSVNGLVVFEIVGVLGDDFGFVVCDVWWKWDFVEMVGECGDGFVGGN